jgi:hypothetical protein
MLLGKWRIAREHYSLWVFFKMNSWKFLGEKDSSENACEEKEFDSLGDIETNTNGMKTGADLQMDTLDYEAVEALVNNVS